MTLEKRRPLRSVGGLDGTVVDGVSTARERSPHLARLTAILRRAIDAGEAVDRLVVVPEGGGSPLLQMDVAPKGEAQAEQIAAEALEAIDDDASLSGGGAYRVIIAAGEATIATQLIRVRASSAYEHERRAGETSEGALLRQLMRHQESTMRLAQEGQLRSFEALARMLDRQDARLVVLEKRQEEEADRRVERLRVELEHQRAGLAEQRQDEIAREAVKMLAPAVPTLMRRLLGAGAAASSTTASSTSTATDRAVEKKATPKDEAAARALEVLCKQPREAIEALASMMEAEEGAALLAAYDAGAAQKSGASPAESANHAGSKPPK